MQIAVFQMNSEITLRPPKARRWTSS